MFVCASDRVRGANGQPSPRGAGRGWPERSEGRVRGRREQQSQSSLPGLTRQSILFAKKFVRRGWTRGSSPRVTEGCVARDCPSPGSRLRRSPPSPRKAGRGCGPSSPLAHSTPHEHLASSASPPAPALARGGGGGAGVALERVPFQRDGLRGGLARRDRLGREVVVRDGGGDRVGGGAQLLRLGVVDQSLLPRFLDVARVPLVQAIAQRLRRNRELEGAFEAREPLVADAVEDIDREAVT